MKYLLLILLLLTSLVFAGEVEDIDARIIEIDARILVVPAELSDTQDLINSKSLERDALPIDDPQTFILQEEIDALVTLRKELLQEEIDLENEKVSKLERKRQLLWYARAKAIPDLRLAMKYAGLQQPNSKLLIKDIVESKDDTRLIALEAATSQVNAEIQKRLIEEGISKRFRCVDKVKKKMFYLNYGKGLTKIQVKKFVKDMKDIIDLIDAASLESAREDILAVIADGTIITEADKNEMLSVIDSCK